MVLILTSANKIRAVSIISLSKNDETDDMIVELLSLGFNVDVQDSDENNALHIAVKEGWGQLCEDLVCAGVSLHQCNKFGETPLDIAFNLNDTETRECLKEFYQEASTDSEDLELETAMGASHLMDSRELLSLYADLNVQDLEAQAAHDDEEFVRWRLTLKPSES